MKTFPGDAIAQIEHRICLSPVLAIFPKLDRVSAHQFRHFHQPWIFHIEPVAQEDLVVSRHQSQLQLIGSFRRARHSGDVAELVGKFCGRQNIAAQQLLGLVRFQGVHNRIID